jgi:hypothetical protein
MEMAGKDPYNTEKIYEKLFNFKETEALNYQFENFFIDNMNPIIQSGPAVITFLGIFVNYIFWAVMRKMTVKCWKIKACRKIGIVAMQNTHLAAPIYEAYIAIYLDLALCAGLGLIAIY